jgi:hypothetical protein
LIFCQAADKGHFFEIIMKNFNSLGKTFRRLLKNAQMQGARNPDE